MWLKVQLGKAFLGVAAWSVCGAVLAADWRVEVTNVTRGQSFTPILAVAHYPFVQLFELGDPASAELSALAEGGETAPLTAVLEGQRGVASVQTIGGLLGPGESRSFTVSGRIGQSLSLAAMLVPTNDTFFAIDRVILPVFGSAKLEALAYDAGSEANDQDCANMPGPGCGGAGISPPASSDEGFVHVGNGFHYLGNGPGILQPAHYDWNNPVAIVTIRRIH